MNASNSALFPRTQEDSTVRPSADMASSTPTQPRHEGVTTQSGKAELEAKIGRLQEVISRQREQIGSLEYDTTKRLNHIRALDDRLLSVDCERAGLKERLVEFERVKDDFQRFLDTPESKAEELSKELDETVAKLGISESEKEQLQRYIGFMEKMHGKEVEDLKKAASDAERDCWSLTKYYHEENTIKVAVQQHAEDVGRSTALELEKLKEELAVTKKEVDHVRSKDAEYWDTLYADYCVEAHKRQAAEDKAKDLAKRFGEWLKHDEENEARSQRMIEAVNADHEEQHKRLKARYKEKRKQALADLREEYDKEGAALLARNTGLEVQVSQLQEEAQLQQAAISSLGHRLSIAREALDEKSQQVNKLGDKLSKKTEECATLMKHEVELRAEQKEAAEAADRAEEETKRYVEIAESRADALVKEKVELQARLAGANTRLTMMYQGLQALKADHNKELEKERQGWVLERQLLEAGVKKYQTKLKTRGQQLWGLAHKHVKLVKELEVQKEGDFGVEALDEDGDEQQCERPPDTPKRDEREGQVGATGSGWETDGEDSYDEC